MKKIIVAALSIGFFLHAEAQSAGNTQPQIPLSVQQELKILDDAGLNLSDLQKTRLTHVLMMEADMIERNRQATDGNKAVWETRLKEIRKHKIQNILGVMTEQQAQKFNALKLDEKFTAE